MSEMDNGPITDWKRSGSIQKDENGDTDYEANGKITKDFFMEYLAPYFKYTSIVDGKNTIDENGNKSGENSKIYLADGSTVEFWNGSCIDFIFDVNGDSKPNKTGRDKYRFLVCLDDLARNDNCGDEKRAFCSYRIRLSDIRDEILEKCKTNNAYCNRLLEVDGWEFKKDYPYRL